MSGPVNYSESLNADGKANYHKINYAFGSVSLNQAFSLIPTTKSLIPILIRLILILTIGGISAATARPNEHPIKSSNGSTNQALLETVTKLLRLKLFVDQYNYDDIAIGFNSGASTAYNPNEDSSYLPGINAPEGLSCFSSDGVPLSINLLPLPQQASVIIRLDVEAANSGPITLKRTELDSLPPIYSIWLVDRYKKDSINLRTDSNYVFIINKADTASFGSYRFYVAVRMNAPAPFQFLEFNAVKSSSDAELSWTTKNEENNTHFEVERSSDGGSIFQTIDTLTSTAAGTYNFTDTKLPTVPVEYRLKITDVAGAVSYSNEVTLLYSNTINNSAANISIYPNPASSILNLKIDQNNSDASNNVLALESNNSFPTFAANNINNRASYNIKIINITGSVVKNATSASASWQNDITNLNPGTYIIQIVNNKDNSFVGRGTFIKM